MDLTSPDRTILRPREIKLQTLKGSFIPNYRRLDYQPERLRAGAQHMMNQFPDIKLRSLSACYNCAGLVFAKRKTWIDEMPFDRILEEDGYRKLPAGTPEVGDVALYRESVGADPAHIGVVVAVRPVADPSETGVLVLSKWGENGEFFHPAELVPEYLGNVIEYWTERNRHGL